MRLHFRRRRQRPRLDDTVQHDVFQFRRAVDLHRIAPVGLELERIGDAQGVGAGLHLREFVLAVVVRVNGRAHAIRCDQLDHHAFGRIAAGHAHRPRSSAGKAALHRPFTGLRSVPGICGKMLALDAAFVAVQVADHILHVRIGQRGAERGHARPALFDMRSHVFLVDGHAGDQSRSLEKSFEGRSGLLVLVMAGPALVPVNVLPAVGAAVGHLEIVVGSVGALEIVAVGGGSGRIRSAVGRASSLRRPSHGNHARQNDNEGTRAQ